MKSSKRIAKYNLTNRLENEMRVSHPKRGLKADYQRSRTAAIQLFCLSCMGGCRADVVACTSKICPLWQFRPGAKKGMRPPGIPSEADYNEMIGGRVSNKQSEAGRKLGKEDDVE